MKIPKDKFLDSLGDRQRGLAEAMMAGAPGSELLEKFSPTIIMEMGHKIRRKMEGMEDFIYEFSVEKETVVPDPVDDETSRTIGLSTGQKKTHVTKMYNNAPLEWGCCGG